jgi:hypothetical protein
MGVLATPAIVRAPRSGIFEIPKWERKYEMRKIQTLIFIVLAVCMLGAFVASSVFALETLPAEFLAGGAVIPEGLTSD